MARPAAPHYGLRALEMGIKDSLDVWELQIKLIGWGSGSLDGLALKDEDRIGVPMDPVRVTGTYDSTTADAVRRFQKAHDLPVTGICDAATFRAIDREQADHPVFVDTLKCRCVARAALGPVAATLCRCNAHPTATVACAGFGGGNFAGAYTHTDNLDLYDKREYPGMDKAALWAVRALMHRAGVSDIQVVAGYRCWFDNYDTTDDTRWKHRTSTFHMGKTIEIRHRGVCIDSGDNPCPECDRIRSVALAKCGFQLRWQEEHRVSVAEGAMEARPPATPFSVHVNTVRRKDKEDDDFVQTDADALKPLYEGKAGFCFPMDLGAGRDPMRAPSADLFDNIETKEGGGFPLGANRLWHTGVHLHAATGKEVYAITDGEIVGCRVGEAEQAKAFGSRNFVLLRHKRKDKAYYTLTMHLDAETAKADATVGWRKQLFVRTKDHVEALAPSPVYKHVPAQPLLNPPVPSRLVPQGHQTGLAKGEAVEVTGNAVNPKTALDPSLPDNCEVYKLTAQSGDGRDQYVFTKRSNVAVATKRAPVGGLADKITNSEVIGLKDPIPVHGGELVGKVAAAPTNGGLAFAKTFVHVEAFSEENLLTGVDFPGYKLLDASSEDNVAVRDAVAKELVKEKLLDAVPDDVLAEVDIQDLPQDPNVGRLRSAVLKMKSAWDLDWKAALQKSATFSFMEDGARDDLGDSFNDYRFWADVDAAEPGQLLPASVVHHYHPIVLLLAFAYKPETP